MPGSYRANVPLRWSLLTGAGILLVLGVAIATPPTPPWQGHAWRIEHGDLVAGAWHSSAILRDSNRSIQPSSVRLGLAM
jgi:hypothetical protein